MKVKLTLVYCAFGMGDSFHGRYKFKKEIELAIAYEGLNVVVTLEGQDSVPFTLKDVTANEDGTVSAKLFYPGQGRSSGFEKYYKEDAYCANSDGPATFSDSGWLVEEFPIKD